MTLTLPANFPNLDLSALKPKEQYKYYSFLDYLARKLARQGKRFPFVNVHSKRLKGFFGNKYPSYMRKLIEAGIIKEQKSKKRPDSKRGRYSAGGINKATGDYFKPYAKAYRLCSTKTIKHQFHYTPKKVKVYENRTDKSDPVAMRQSDVLKLIQIDLAPHKGDPYLYDCMVFNAKCAAGTVTTCKNSRRKTHCFIQAKKDVRRLATMDGQPICIFDLKSAYAALLVADVDPTEKARYSELYNKDIYSISPKLREDAKKQFGQFLFGETHSTGRKRKDGSYVNPFTQYFSVHFPLTFKTIYSYTGSAFSNILSARESSIFNDVLIPLSTELGIKALNCYDGFAVNNLTSGDALKKLCEDEMEKRFGMRPLIECKSIPKSNIVYSENQRMRIAELKQLGIADNYVDTILAKEFPTIEAGRLRGDLLLEIKPGTR